MTESFAVFADPAIRSSAGIERYARVLLDAIAESGWADRCLLATSQPAALRLVLAGRPAERLESVPVRLPPRLMRYVWAAGAAPLERVIGRSLRFVHSPAHQRIAGASPYVATIHDVLPARRPDLMTRRQRLVFADRLDARCVRHAAHLIADSESTRADLIDLFRIKPERTTVVPLGVDHRRFRPTDDRSTEQAVLDRYGIRRPYVLYVGSLYARKLGRLLEAFAVVARRMPEVQLVIAGGRETGEPRERVVGRIEALGLDGRALLVGEVPDADVPVLMSGCEVFVYVSLFEGFGLTPLEAMACGAPVVAAATTSLPEVVGDAGLLVDPLDTDAIAEAILLPLADGQAQARMRAASTARAAGFSWEQTARDTLAVFERCGWLDG